MPVVGMDLLRKPFFSEGATGTPSVAYRIAPLTSKDGGNIIGFAMDLRKPFLSVRSGFRRSRTPAQWVGYRERGLKEGSLSLALKNWRKLRLAAEANSAASLFSTSILHFQETLSRKSRLRRHFSRLICFRIPPSADGGPLRFWLSGRIGHLQGPRCRWWQRQRSGAGEKKRGVTPQPLDPLRR